LRLNLPRPTGLEPSPGPLRITLVFLRMVSKGLSRRRIS
jgi:hypothetical protein